MNKCRKNITGFKKLRVKIIKKRKKKRKKETRGNKKENSTEWEKPNEEAEVYNNNKKCD